MMSDTLTKRVCAEKGCRTPLSRYNKAKKCFVHDTGVPRLRGRSPKVEKQGQIIPKIIPQPAPKPSVIESNIPSQDLTTDVVLRDRSSISQETGSGFPLSNEKPKQEPPRIARRRARQRAPDDALTTAKVEEMTGATSRQLNHWIHKGYIDGQGPLGGPGSLRVWTWMQVNRVRELLWFKQEVLIQAERMGVDANFTILPNPNPRVGPRA